MTPLQHQEDKPKCKTGTGTAHPWTLSSFTSLDVQSHRNKREGRQDKLKTGAVTGALPMK